MQLILLHRRNTGAVIGIPVNQIQHVMADRGTTLIAWAMAMSGPPKSIGKDPRTGQEAFMPGRAEPGLAEAAVWETPDEIQRLLFSINLWHEHGDAGRVSSATFSQVARTQAEAMKPAREFGGGARDGEVYVAR